jgi:response regulator RpfG family c-di-GMP phosphodiesterase
MNKHPNPKHTIIQQQQADFVNQELNLPGLDGILMANSLHYVKNKPAVITKLSSNLEEDGSFIIVEYNTAIANKWVSYPIGYQALKELFEKAGFTQVIKLREKPSLYGRANLYAAYISR